MTDLDRIADAAVACALQDDPAGYAVLVRDLEPAELRHLGARLAQHTATAMSSWAEGLGVLPAQALEMWQEVILRRQLGDGLL